MLTCIHTNKHMHARTHACMHAHAYIHVHACAQLYSFCRWRPFTFGMSPSCSSLDGVAQHSNEMKPGKKLFVAILGLLAYWVVSKRFYKGKPMKNMFSVDVITRFSRLANEPTLFERVHAPVSSSYGSTKFCMAFEVAKTLTEADDDSSRTPGLHLLAVVVTTTK